MLVQDKSFIVTGGLGAIGGACARLLLSKGAYVVIFDVVPQDKGAGLAEAIGPKDRCFYVSVDITDIEALDKICQTTVLGLVPKGSLSGAVHCAGIAPGRKWSHRLVESAPTFERVFKVNAYGTFAVDACIADAINAQYPDNGPFGPRVTEERGCIVNIASVVAAPVPGRCLTYGASKTAVRGITEGMADFLGPFGIRVNSVSPAIVASAIMGPERVPYFKGELEAGCIFPRRLSEPEEVASGCIFLIENSMMNDHHLSVTGGWRGTTMWAPGTDPRSMAPSLE